jgi:hypothetical protein
VVPIAEMTPEVGAPGWWLARLTDELTNRQPEMQGYRDLVDGRHPEPDSVETARKFRMIAGLSTTNLTGLAVEVTAQRIEVEGVRIGDDPNADKDVWDNIWQRSDFDQGSQDATTSALVYGRSCVSVEPPNSGSDYARLHYEDPRQVVVAYAPDGQTRVAALKVFQDPWTGTVFGTLYTPNLVVRMERVGSPGRTDTFWAPRIMPSNGDAVTTNPIGEVPFFELQNKITGAVMSEVEPLVIPQRRLNQIVFNTDAIAEYGAFRQKWATGIEVLRDDQGRPIAPYEPNIAKLFASDKADVTFGSFDVTDMKPYIDLAQEAALQISRLSQVPLTYFLPNISNIGSEALALLTSGLVLKAKRQVKGYEPALEGAVRLALRTQGDRRAEVANIEINWANTETRSVAQDADAALKLTQGDNPVITTKSAQEMYLGMTQTERDRDQAWRDAQPAPSASDLATP